MADTKISALPAASTPLAGTELVPIVQGGVTKNVSIANLTAGRTVDTGPLYSGNVGFNATSSSSPVKGNLFYVTDGTGWRMDFGKYQSSVFYPTFSIDDSRNLNISVAGQGVNFNANSAAAGMTSQLLNWYEEGTWTPVVTSGTGTITSYTAAGRYTRIGRQVTLTWYIGVTNNGTGASYIHITGAPYSSGVGNTALFGFNQSTGAACTGAINGTALDMYKYDATYPVATGQTINGSITYSV